MSNSYKLTITSVSLALAPVLHLLNHHSPTAPAHLVLRNAVVFTSDPSLPFAESFTVRYRRILRVGDYPSLEDLVGERTKVVDVGGKVVAPVFIDSHVHFIVGVLEMALVDLQEVNPKDEFVRRVKEAQGSWLLLVDGTMIYGEENYLSHLGLIKSHKQPPMVIQGGSSLGLGQHYSTKVGWY